MMASTRNSRTAIRVTGGLSWVVLGLVGLVGLAWGRGLGDLPDSLPPSIKWYLEQREKHDWFRYPQPFGERNPTPESLNMRMVGKWGRGPASWITGRDSLVFMSMGSEVAVFSALDKTHIRILAEIRCRNMAGRPVLKDSFLFVGTEGPVEVYNIANPSRPVLVSRGPALGPEIALEDSLIYILGTDSLVIYNIRNPDDFRFVGACRDSGYDMCVADGFAYLCDRWGLYVIDARDPTHPHRATTLTGAQTGAVTVDSGYCYYTTMSASPAALVIADVSDPYHPYQVGSRSDIGGYDIYKLGMFVCLPAHFDIVDVSNPSDPTLISSAGYGGNGIWTRSLYNYGFLGAGSDGLAMVNITDPVHPFLDTTIAGADVSYDVCANNGFAYVANDYCGMKVVDVRNIADPREVGSYDSAGPAPNAYAVKARDSFAYLVTRHWLPTAFKVVDVSDPLRPVLAGACPMGWGSAVAARDSLAYVAEDGQLEIFSIANPWNPRLVGSCGLPNSSFGLFLRDSLAYVANLTSVQIVDVARPDAPIVIGSCSIRALGIQVRDTVAFVAGYDAGFYALSVADPRSPRVLSNLYFPEFCQDVAVQGSLAYLGANKLHLIDVSDLSNMREVGYYGTPGRIRRLFRAGAYVYAACFGAGVCIFETTGQSGFVESSTSKAPSARLSAYPNPAANWLTLSTLERPKSLSRIEIRDIGGRVMMTLPVLCRAKKEVSNQTINISTLPEGCYFVEVQSSSGGATAKFVKMR